MIVARAPVRFSLGGGGSDLPAYASAHGGFVVAAAVDKFVNVLANRRFFESIRVSYAKTENVGSVDEIEHPIVREALRMTGIERGVELVSVADVPANSGLGSSGSFAVALLLALHAYRGEAVSPRALAEEACEIEMQRLAEPVGKQDPYVAAFGGVVGLTIERDLSVHVEPLDVAPGALASLEANLHVFHYGHERKAAEVLAHQRDALRSRASSVDAMHRIKALGFETRRLLARGAVDEYGELMHAHWTEKRRLSAEVTSGAIDEHYEAARAAGAIGGKIMGAGGGGFFLFYARDAAGLRRAMTARGLRHVPFRFEASGARVLFDGGDAKGAP